MLEMASASTSDPRLITPIIACSLVASRFLSSGNRKNVLARERSCAGGELASPGGSLTRVLPDAEEGGPRGKHGFPVLLGLVEEAAALEQPRALLGGDLDVPRREQEHLVGDALHAAVERVAEPAGEVDQPLRQVLVGALQIEDHRRAVLEAVGDLLGVVEAPRDDEMYSDGGARDGRELRTRGRRPLASRRARGGAIVALRIGPVVEVALRAATRRQPPDVRPLAVAPLELLLGGVAVLVPVLVLLGDSEVDKRAIPDVGKTHGCRILVAEQAGSQAHER